MELYIHANLVINTNVIVIVSDVVGNTYIKFIPMICLKVLGVIDDPKILDAAEYFFSEDVSLPMSTRNKISNVSLCTLQSLV